MNYLKIKTKQSNGIKTISDAWGSGTLKIISSCKEAGLPDPEIIEQDGGILVTMFKNKYSKGQLQILGLNDRQVKAVLYVVETGSITNSSISRYAIRPKERLYVILKN